MHTEILYLDGNPPVKESSLDFIVPLDIGAKYTIEMNTYAGDEILAGAYTLSAHMSTVGNPVAFAEIITAPNSKYAAGTWNSLAITEKEGFTGKYLKVTIKNVSNDPVNVSTKIRLYLTTYYD